MADDDKRARPAAAVRAANEVAQQRAKASAERPFDMWLQKQLHAMYDEIASEPLPNDLLNLIDHDAAASEGPKGGSGRTPGGKKS